MAKGGEDNSDIREGEESVDLDPNDSWTAKFWQLREYRIANGDCAVPRTNSNVGQWVNNQRRAYGNVKSGKKGLNISEERINMLDDLGFHWGKKFPTPATWDERLEELRKYSNAMGDCNVNISPTNPSPLAKWVSAQRKEYRRFKKGRDSLLTLEQIAKLKEIGFNWKGPRLA